jgi:hypothetical protein
MAPAAAPPAWPAHPLAEALLRFHLLPSLTLHPSRAGAWAGFASRGDAPAGLHRHWSADMLRELPEGDVTALDDPALPVAMLPPAAFDRLLLTAGVVLNAQHIRRTIARDAVAKLRDELGEPLLALARARPADELPEPAAWDAGKARATCIAAGTGLVAQSLEAASPAVAGRGRLRLPADAEPLRRSLASAGLDPQRALATACELVQSLEPQWHSSFPARH